MADHKIVTNSQMKTAACTAASADSAFSWSPNSRNARLAAMLTARNHSERTRRRVDTISMITSVRRILKDRRRA
jgi:hypothetical protein